jgi:cell division protein FtsL
MLRGKINKKESKVFLVFFSTFILFFFIFLIFLTIKIEQKKGELKNELKELKGKVTELQERKKFLQDQINKSQRESFWEERVREEGYAKEGENLVVILNSENSSPNEANQNNQEKEKNFLEKIKEIFIKNIFRH